MSRCGITNKIKGRIHTRLEQIQAKFRNAADTLEEHNGIHNKGHKWIANGTYSISAKISDDVVCQHDERPRKVDSADVFLLLTKAFGRQLINEFVLNGKKQITQRDFIRACDDLRIQGVGMNDLVWVWPLFDGNGDGDVTLEEFSYTLANYRVLVKQFLGTSKAALRKASQGAQKFEETLIKHYYNSPAPAPQKLRTVTSKGARSSASRPLPEADGGTRRNTEQDGAYKDSWFSEELDALHGSTQNDGTDARGGNVGVGTRLETKISEFRTINAVKKAIDSVKQKRRAKSDRRAEHKHRKGTKYGFTKHERRFLGRMKMWIENSIRLSKANVLFTMYNTFSCHDLCDCKELEQPFRILVQEIGGPSLLEKFPTFLNHLRLLNGGDKSTEAPQRQSSHTELGRLRKFHLALHAARKQNE